MTQTTNHFIKAEARAIARKLTHDTATLCIEDPEKGNEVTFFADGPKWLNRFRRIEAIFNEEFPQHDAHVKAFRNQLDDEVPF